MSKGKPHDDPRCACLSCGQYLHEATGLGGRVVRCRFNDEEGRIELDVLMPALIFKADVSVSFASRAGGDIQENAGAGEASRDGAP
jgi:hypothetical protein